MIPKDYRNVDLMSIIFKTTSLLDFLSCRHVTVKTMSHSVWNTLHLLKMLLQMYLHKLSFGHNFTSKCLTSPIHSQPSSVNVQWTSKEHTSRRMKLSRKTWRENEKKPSLRRSQLKIHGVSSRKYPYLHTTYSTMGGLLELQEQGVIKTQNN